MRIWCAFGVGAGHAVIEEIVVRKGAWPVGIEGAVAYLESLEVPSYTVQMPSGVKGDSFGLPFVIAVLASELGWRLERDFVVTGRVSVEGNIETVGYIPEKMKAAAGFGLRRFIYPQLIGDLTRSYAQRVEMTRRSLSGVCGVACRSVDEVVRFVVSPVDRVIGFLRTGLFGNASDVQKIMVECVRVGDNQGVSRLLEAQLPGIAQDMGRLLYGALLSLPPVVREERFMFPLISRDRLLSATVVDDCDFELLSLANEGRFTFEETTSQYFQEKRGHEIEVLADFLCSELSPQRLVETVTGAIDEARATFVASQVYSEFDDVLRAYAVHLSRFCGETHFVGTLIDTDFEELLVAEFPVREKMSELGLRCVLDRVTNRLKKDVVQTRARRLVMRAVLPLDGDDEEALVTMLASRLGVMELDWECLLTEFV